MTAVFTLTAKERATAERMLPRAWSQVQKATLESRLRTGFRIGCSVAGGALIVDVCGYRLNREGEPSGYAKLIPLSGRLSEREAIALIAGLTAGDIVESVR